MSPDNHPDPPVDSKRGTSGPVTRPAPPARPGAGPQEGGEAACWAHLVCHVCGAMESEGHRPDCQAAAPR
jgi:hypothetical protein